MATRSSDEPCELLPSGQTETTVFTEKWSLGGDYRQIASIPIDTNQVFGSTTQEPADLYSYRPAFISRESAREFSSDLLRQDGSYVEPLDGTQNGSWITFLGRQISSASTENHQEDNAFFPWTVYAWDIDNQRLNTVMSWTDLPAHNPRSSGELPPVSDGKNAYYGARVSGEHGEFSVVVTRGLSDSTRTEPTQVLFFGAYPAVSTQGLSAVATAINSTVPSRVVTLSGSDFSSATTNFEVKSQEYKISGLYAYGHHHAVVLTPSPHSSAASSYLGIWDDRSSLFPRQWITLDSPTPWVSIGEEAVAWGAGSQAENAQMYLRSWETGTITLIGQTPGYSRPVVAARGRVLLVPRLTQTGAIEWKVGEFSEE